MDIAELGDFLLVVCLGLAGGGPIALVWHLARRSRWLPREVCRR